jgi:hypothetical protein
MLSAHFQIAKLPNQVRDIFADGRVSLREL